MRQSILVERALTGLVVLLTAATLGALAVVVVLRSASNDLHAQAAVAAHEADPPVRSTVIDQRLSALLAGDVPRDAPRAMAARAAQLDDRSDRLTEASAVLALLGMLSGLLVMPPALAPARREWGP